MSTSSQDPFPDLHQKMSKKIAQLTKVIYQLNTRNEDHQSEIDSITHNHQQETQRLMLDAASKIGKFKDLMDIRKNAVSSFICRTGFQFDRFYSDDILFPDFINAGCTRIANGKAAEEA